jgi:hypothetical protein
VFQSEDLSVAFGRTDLEERIKNAYDVRILALPAD